MINRLNLEKLSLDELRELHEKRQQKLKRKCKIPKSKFCSSSFSNGYIDICDHCLFLEKEGFEFSYSVFYGNGNIKDYFHQPLPQKLHYSKLTGYKKLKEHIRKLAEQDFYKDEKEDKIKGVRRTLHHQFNQFEYPCGYVQSEINKMQFLNYEDIDNWNEFVKDITLEFIDTYNDFLYKKWEKSPGTFTILEQYEYEELEEKFYEKQQELCQFELETRSNSKTGEYQR